jgi:hypothetical protein
MRNEFVTALHEAQGQDTAEARVERIKRAVTKEVRAADPAVSVRFTEYFNNVVVPDMVLRWPEESRERLLFVRPSANPVWLEDDVATLASHRPMIFTLEDIDANGALVETKQFDRLTEHASSVDTWIAGPSAIEGVAEARSNSPVIGLLGQALVRGGKGVSTGQSVRALTATTERAFRVAEEPEGESIAQSVASLEHSLDAQQAGRFTRILRAVWEGHGGLGSAFPTVSSTGPLTDDDLSYLMKTLEDAPPEFWRRVGKNIATAQLARLRLEDPSRSLQKFVKANLESLTVKGIRLSAQQIRLDEPEQFPRWVIDRGCLAIRGTEWIAYLAARKAEELPPTDIGKPLSLVTLRQRVRNSNVLVIRVEFGKGDRGVYYESKERLDILDDEDLAKVADEVQGMLVERATVALRGAGTATVEFAGRTALGPTNSTLPVGTLARGTLPLLVTFQEEEAAAVNELLAPFEEDTLFAASARDSLPEVGVQIAPMDRE